MRKLNQNHLFHSNIPNHHLLFPFLQ